MAKSTSVTRSIDAPRERVWGLLTDVAEQRRWNTTLESIDGEIAEGGTVTLVAKINPKRTFKLAVSGVAEPTRMTWSDGMPMGLFTGTRTFVLAEEGSGTRFTMSETYTGLLSGLIARSIPDMTDAFEEYADALKAAAEAGSGGGSSGDDGDPADVVSHETASGETPGDAEEEAAG